jgi:hypothetical protein
MARSTKILKEFADALLEYIDHEGKTIGILGSATLPWHSQELRTSKVREWAFKALLASSTGLPRGGVSRGRGGGGRGGINPEAQQFAPRTAGAQGSKRPHEGGDEGTGKRMGGGAGGCPQKVPRQENSRELYGWRWMIIVKGEEVDVQRV